MDNGYGEGDKTKVKVEVSDTDSSKVDTKGLKQLKGDFDTLAKRYEAGEITWPDMLNELKAKIDAIEEGSEKKPGFPGMQDSNEGMSLDGMTPEE